MTLDARINFGKCVVSTGYDSAATSITLVSGEGAKLPSVAPYNLVWYNNTTYADPADDPNREIVRCTARTGDVLTVTRAQESTTATSKNSSGCVYKMICGGTAKTLDDIDTLAIDIGDTYVWVTSYGAMGDGTNDDTAAVQEAIDYVADNDGGVVHFPKGTYKITSTLTVGPYVTLRGYGMDVSIIDYAVASGNAITLDANADSFTLEKIRLKSSLNSTGWAVTAPSSVVRDIVFDKVNVTNFLKGISITGDALNTRIRDCRMTGQGGATASGIAIQLGDGTFGGNQALVDGCYTSSYFTHIKNYTVASTILSHEFEVGSTALELLGSASCVLLMPWFGSGGSAFTTYDIDVQTGNGVCAIGYGSASWNIHYGDVSSRGRTIILPDRLDMNEGSVYKGVKLGNFHVFGGSAPAAGWVDNATFNGWRMFTASNEVTLSGATSDWTNGIPAGCVVFGVTSYVTETITGCTGKSIGTAATTDLWATTNTGLSVGSTTGDGNGSSTFPIRYTSATNIRVTATGGGASFTGGKIRIAVTYLQNQPPTG